MRIADILGIVLIFMMIAYVGYRSSKKVKNMQDFTLAGGNIGRIQAGFSMAATEFGGSSLVGAMALCYSVGVAGAWWDWSAVPAFLLLGIFFAGKIKLPHMVTITDFFERRYSYQTKLLTSLMHILAITTQITTQFMVGAAALNGIAGVPKNTGIFFAAVFILIYTMAGGLMAVVNTDVLQFVIIMLSILVAVPISLQHAGGFSGLSEALPDGFLSFTNIDPLTVFSWCLFCFFTYSTSQHYIQRVFAAKNRATAQFAFLFTGCAYFVYGILVSLIGVCIAVLLPNLSDPNTGYALLIKHYMPAGVAGLVLGGIFAASLSTAASMLLAASTLFINDIYKPLLVKREDPKGDLKAIRLVTVVVSLFSLGISMFMDNIVNIMYLGGLFYSTSVFFPLVIGLKWKRATAPAALISILASVVVGLVSEFYWKGMAGILGLPSNVLSASTSLLVFLLVSLLTKRPSAEKLAFLSETEA